MTQQPKKFDVEFRGLMLYNIIGICYAVGVWLGVQTGFWTSDSIVIPMNILLGIVVGITVAHAPILLIWMVIKLHTKR